MMRSLAVLLLLFGLLSAIHVIAPVDTQVDDGGSVYIGEIGPGQTIAVLIEETATTGGKFGTGGVYDTAVFDKVPAGWSGKESKLYAHPLYVYLTADPQAKEGDYLAKVKVADENAADELKDVSFWVKVRVTYDVMDASVQPTTVKTGPGQPARFAITIANKGSTGDAFDISTKGAKRWELKKQVFVPAKSSKTFNYEIAADEEGTYASEIAVVSTASPIIHEEKNVSVVVQSGILGDMKATNNGVMLFPIFESLIYSFFGLISNLY